MNHVSQIQEVLLNNNFEFKVREVQRDENGNFTIISLFAMVKELLLVNVYGPNKTTQPFIRVFLKLSNATKIIRLWYWETGTLF